MGLPGKQEHLTELTDGNPHSQAKRRTAPITVDSTLYVVKFSPFLTQQCVQEQTLVSQTAAEDQCSSASLSQKRKMRTEQRGLS